MSGVRWLPQDLQENAATPGENGMGKSMYFSCEIVTRLSITCQLQAPIVK
ncbi:MAG: hypothetical protein V3R25_01200 [Nitrosomonadaceae bacterium]|jgi:hypothetical protein